jgi:hypothetical protein
VLGSFAPKVLGGRAVKVLAEHRDVLGGYAFNVLGGYAAQRALTAARSTCSRHTSTCAQVAAESQAL